MQYGLLYLPVHTQGLKLPEILDIDTMQSFVSHKVAAKLPATIQTTTLLTTKLPIGKTMATISAIQLDIFMLILSIHNIAIHHLLQIH